MSTSGPNGTGDDLDARLQALFADPRLDVVPTPRVGERIVAGARRRRSRRVALTGSGTTLAVVAAAVAIVASGSHSDEKSNQMTVAASPPQAPPVDGSTLGTLQDNEHADPSALPESHQTGTPSSPSGGGASSEPGGSPQPSTPVESGRILIADAVLATDGYRELKLGMSYSDALATNLLVVSGESPPQVCADYALAEGDSSVRAVTISREYGVVGFTAGNAVTPEGAGVGTPVDELENLYPEGRAVDGAYVVDTGTGVYEFTAADGVVDALELRASSSDC